MLKNMIQQSNRMRLFFRLLWKKVIAYVQDYEAQVEKVEMAIELSYLPYLEELIEIIEQTDNFNDLPGEELQALVFIIPKKYDLKQPEWFKFLYSVLLGKERGPRLGPFLSILCKEAVLSMLKKAVAKYAA
ncbi:hypothetical protein BGS_0207 [Beggiatoa sp. SS]|nr:hypothetical protein BGS_0207 [Beggiatoa sp. SS]